MRDIGETDGFVEVVSGRESDRIPGDLGDLISEVVPAMEFCASSEDLARTCHAHPGLGEGLKEAALAVGKRALHIQDRVRHARASEESLHASCDRKMQTRSPFMLHSESPAIVFLVFDVLFPACISGASCATLVHCV